MTETDEILARANWDLVPEHMREGIKLWISDGIAPGSFMTAVLCNDLKEAFGRADHINRERIHDIVSFFYSYAPRGCWGSPENVAAWANRGGVNKRNEAA